MHNATAITTGSANQRPNTPCIRLWIDVTFRGLEDSYFSPPPPPSRPIFSYVPPIASSPLPSPLTCTLSAPHLPARRLIAVVVTEP